jgi:N-acetylmuramoyl-L-alanine amidase
MVWRWEVFVLRCVEHGGCKGLTASPSGERHGAIIPVPVKVMEKVGTYRFVLHFYDDYGDSYKDHEPKPALEVNATIKPIIVCIDPGHGGDKPGAVGPTGLTEKEANWEIALKIRERLQKEGYKVRMTRLKDEHRGLKERIEIAHGKRSEEGKLLNKPEPPADIFVSIHNNAVPPGSGREPLGAIVFYYKPIDYRLAQCLYNYLHKANPGNIKDGLREGDFFVLRNTNMPAALCECEFISSKDGEKNLKDESFRKKIADAICDGINEYFGKLSKGR